MNNPKVYADFHNADALGRVRLNCTGTLEDLARQHIELRDGLVLTLYTDDLDRQGNSDELLVDGAVSYSNTENCWVAAIEWTAIHHVSSGNRTGSNGRRASAPAASLHGATE